MKIYIVLFFLLISLGACSLFNHAGKVEFSGTITVTESYCGGAIPSEDMMEQMNRPRSPGKKIIYYKSGTSNQPGDTSQLQYFVTKSDGTFSIFLKPGKYVFFDENKKVWSPPKNTNDLKYDIPCLEKKFLEGDFSIDLNSKGVKDFIFNYHSFCNWNLPCTEFRGQVPPSVLPPPR